ncbi:response regulator [Christensenellaceae bacterium]|nr:response regulator [Christensenellaceae bacterium]BDF61259.1 response regulator [Christensenellaceae bacterium]
MYRMTVLKREYQKPYNHVIGSIKDNRFRIEVMPLDKDISADWFISRPVDLLVVDVCTDPEIGLSLMRSLRLAGARTEMIAYIARNDCDTLRAVLKLGVLDCLVDPLDTDRFNQAVERFLYRAQLWQEEEALSQKTVDAYLSGAGCMELELPKGLQRKTLNMIRAVFNSSPKTCFSCEDIVGTVKLSRITVQRYLQYLHANNELIQNMDYSTGGRPCSLYQYNPGLFA